MNRVEAEPDGVEESGVVNAARTGDATLAVRHAEDWTAAEAAVSVPDVFLAFGPPREL